MLSICFRLDGSVKQEKIACYWYLDQFVCSKKGVVIFSKVINYLKHVIFKSCNSHSFMGQPFPLNYQSFISCVDGVSLYMISRQFLFLSHLFTQERCFISHKLANQTQ